MSDDDEQVLFSNCVRFPISQDMLQLFISAFSNEMFDCLIDPSGH